jgi:hypothetical protein
MEQAYCVKMVEIEHRRARSDPPISSYLSSFARLRRTISAPVNQPPQGSYRKRSVAKESKLKAKKTKGETMIAPIKMVYEVEGIQALDPMRSAPSDLEISAHHSNSASPTESILALYSDNDAVPSYYGPDAAFLLPPPAPEHHTPRPLSTLEEEIAELEANEVARLPVIQGNDRKSWTHAVLESPTRSHTVAPPPLKLRAPIQEAAPTPPSLTVNTPAKEQHFIPTPAARLSPPSQPLPRPRQKKHVRFVPTKPEIITPASTKAAVHYRAQSSRGKQPTAWSAVFLLSTPESKNGSNSRPSTSPGPRPTPHSHTPIKSILRRNSFQNMHQEAVTEAAPEPEPHDPDSDVEIKPLEAAAMEKINAAMEKNLKRLPRNKDRRAQGPRKTSPVPVAALPVFAETPPTPISAYFPFNRIDESERTPSRQYASTPRHSEHHPASPPTPPLPLSARKFRHPVVVNHPPSPPSSSSSSREGSPHSLRSQSSEEMMFKMFAPEPLQISRVTVNAINIKAGKKEERVGRTTTERVD